MSCGRRIGVGETKGEADAAVGTGERDGEVNGDHGCCVCGCCGVRCTLAAPMRARLLGGGECTCVHATEHSSCIPSGRDSSAAAEVAAEAEDAGKEEAAAAA